MLGQRIVTAVVLLAVLVPALLASAQWPFQLLMIALVAAAAWEWARLTGLEGPTTWGFAFAVVLTCVILRDVWSRGLLPASMWTVAGLGWVLGGGWALRAGVQGWGRASRTARLLTGSAILVVAWLALLQARSLGVAFLLSAFMIVWIADIAAYFGGRTFAGPKLAPSISPGKTWSGALTGGVTVLACALAWLHWGPADDAAWVTVPSRLVEHWGAWGASLILCGLVAMSVVGDLFESLLKRSAGVKDSSALLPGHGGVLDRIDALLPVLPLCILCA